MNVRMIKNTVKVCWFLLALTCSVDVLVAQTAMVNVQARSTKSLNGKWAVILDPTEIGDWRQVWQEKRPEMKTDFIEYSFEGGPELNVPGDFNSQMCELTYFEGSVWHKKTFDYKLPQGKRLFLYFGAVNYQADVYLNGLKIGTHEGGFTPFQFEITDKLKDEGNVIIVRVNNKRIVNGLPGTGYDWFNYGGITRDVVLIETNSTFVEDYFLHLKKGSSDTVVGWVNMNGAQAGQKINITIPEIGLSHEVKTNAEGFAEVEFSGQLKLWSTIEPKLYQVVIQSEADQVIDQMGFRSIEVKGSQVLLNGAPVFLKAVNIHEENPYKKARAFSVEDAKILLQAAKELGCNFVRLAHYPHSENMIKEAERMGLMVWEELPVYQHIQFSDSLVPNKMNIMLQEMVRRDKNRCGVVVWSLSNETYPGTPSRTDELISLTQECKALDSTRLIVHVMNTHRYENNTFYINDPLYKYSDIIAINEYIGWYTPWQGSPSEVNWRFEHLNKPVFISEFGGEALFGNKGVPTDEASFWSEEYQEKIYRDQIQMFNTIPNLIGVCPWLLFDYRSLGRMNQVYQKGYNRKGLLSENGKKKKAWYVLRDFYKGK